MAAMDLIKRKHNNILLHIVDVGERRIRIPVASLGNGEGRSILITAGLDGDEYAGIEAAYALIEYYTKQKFEGKLIIIPIVNIPGFESATSWNPLDNKYPKHIFPGKEKGSATEKLMYWLSSNFVKDIDVWIDLHSGASTESLDPFIWAWETKQKAINEKVVSLVSKIKSDRVIFQKTPDMFIENIAKRKTAYILFESGQRGERNKKDIKQHIHWVKQILSSNVIARSEATKQSSKKVITKDFYQNVQEFLAKQDGIWVPMFFGKNVKKPIVLGELRTMDGKVIQKIIAKENGVFLWRREAMFCRKNDSLYAYAYGKASLRA